MGKRRVLSRGGVHAFSSRVVKPHGLTSLTLLIRVDLLRAIPLAIALRAVALGLFAVSTLALPLLARCAIAFVTFALPAAPLLPGARLAIGRGGLGAALRCLDGGFLIVAGVTALVGVAIACHEGHGCGQYHGRDNNLLHLLLRLLFSTLRAPRRAHDGLIFFTLVSIVAQWRCRRLRGLPLHGFCFRRTAGEQFHLL